MLHQPPANQTKLIILLKEAQKRKVYGLQAELPYDFYCLILALIALKKGIVQ
jgi:hypothetical protein